MLSKAIFSLLLCSSFTSVVERPLPAWRESHAENPFRLILSKENVTLHEREIINEEGKGARELKAMFVASSSLNSLVSMLKDQGKGAAWNPGACIYTIIQLGGENWITHIEYDLPWPFNNHDAVVRNVLRQDGNTIEVQLESIEGVIPERKGVERMKRVKGKWTIREIDSSQVEITYQLSSNRGPLPRIITDPIVHYQMVKSMSSLRKLLEAAEL